MSCKGLYSSKDRWDPRDVVLIRLGAPATEGAVRQLKQAEVTGVTAVRQLKQAEETGVTAVRQLKQAEETGVTAVRQLKQAEETGVTTRIAVGLFWQTI
jgi:phage tail tape-measure protein